MKLITNDRELLCLTIAINNLKPERSHSDRQRKQLAVTQFGLDKIEDLASPGGALEKTIPRNWPTTDVEVEIEAGTKNYILEKFGADGEVLGGAFVEATICKLIDRLRA